MSKMFLMIVLLLNRVGTIYMVLYLDDVFPNFEAVTTDGNITFHDWLKIDGWAILFSHPTDFIPVSTTELAKASYLTGQFSEVGVKMIALSCDTVESHNEWVKDIIKYANVKKLGFPIIADPAQELAVELGMVKPDNIDHINLPFTCRNVFIIGPDYKLKLYMVYPPTTGIHFDEIYRVVQSLQLTQIKRVATPVNWKSGGMLMILNGISVDDRERLFPDGIRCKYLPSGKGNMEVTNVHGKASLGYT